MHNYLADSSAPGAEAPQVISTRCKSLSKRPTWTERLNMRPTVGEPRLGE